MRAEPASRHGCLQASAAGSAILSAAAPAVTMRGMKRLLLFVLTLLSPLAHAEWMERVEDGIMGTRIVVELWADDKAQGNAAIAAVLAEMRRVDEGMSTYKPTS